MICFDDEVELVVTGFNDAYGTPAVVERETVSAVVELSTGFVHGNNQDAIDSDAAVYLNPEDTFIADNYYRLEEMLVVINIFGGDERNNWYKITNVSVLKDSQNCNEVDHLLCLLKKTEKPGYVVS